MAEVREHSGVDILFYAKAGKEIVAADDYSTLTAATTGLFIDDNLLGNVSGISDITEDGGTTTVGHFGASTKTAVKTQTQVADIEVELTMDRTSDNQRALLDADRGSSWAIGVRRSTGSTNVSVLAVTALLAGVSYSQGVDDVSTVSLTFTPLGRPLVTDETT